MPRRQRMKIATETSSVAAGPSVVVVVVVHGEKNGCGHSRTGNWNSESLAFFCFGMIGSVLRGSFVRSGA